MAAGEPTGALLGAGDFDFGGVDGGNVVQSICSSEAEGAEAAQADCLAQLALDQLAVAALRFRGGDVAVDLVEGGEDATHVVGGWGAATDGR